MDGKTTMQTKRQDSRNSSFKRKSKTSFSEERKAVVEDTLLLNVVQSYFKRAALVLAVWATGYFKFSPSWLLLALVVYVWKERNSAAKKHKIAIAQQIARDEKGVILARVEDLPSWVYFPDVERAEWVNKMIHQLWPYIGEYVHKLLKDSIEPSIRESLPASLQTFKFSKIDMGDIPPRIGGVKVYTTDVRRNEILMDFEISYSSDSDIAVQVKGITAGVKDLSLRGTMRVIFRPLINKMPLIGGMSVFFLNNPEFSFNLTSLANALEIPGLSDMLHSIVQEQIAAYMVLPNRIPIKLADSVDLLKLRYPQPQGVLRVHAFEARDLKKADISVLGKGKSDPYVILSVGAQTSQTKVIDNTVNPVWNEVFEFIIDERDGQFLDIRVMDKDPGSKDDPLGSTNMDISTIYQKQTVDENVKKGMVHIKTTWLNLADDPLELDRVLQQVRESGQDEESANSALLIVNLDSALNLPRNKKTLVEPSPQVVIKLGQNTQESTVRLDTTEPKWEENYRFFVCNPSLQKLDIEIRDTKTNKSIAETKVHLRDLLAAENMVMDQRFSMKSSETNCTLFMNLILRILTPEEVPEAEPETSPPEGDAGKPGNNEGSSVDIVSKPGTSSDISVSAGSTTSSEAAPKASSAKNDSSQPTNNNASSSATPPVEMIPSASTTLTSETEVRLRKTPSSNVSNASVVEGAGHHGLGRIQLTLRYSLQRQHLVLVVHKIVNLKPAHGDSKNLADPYVRVYLLPDRSSKSKRKTKVVQDNLNPVFDETFEYALSLAELPKHSLEISVKNETGMFSSSQSMMGMVLIDMSTLVDTSRAITQWFDLGPEKSLRPSSLESDV